MLGCAVGRYAGADQLVIIAGEGAILVVEGIIQLNEMDAVIILIHPFTVHELAVLVVQLHRLKRRPVGLDNLMVALA